VIPIHLRCGEAAQKESPCADASANKKFGLAGTRGFLEAGKELQHPLSDAWWR